MSGGALRFINRQIRLGLCGFLLLIFGSRDWACRAQEAEVGAGQNRPNIILILADDLAYRDLGFMGNEQVQTPNLDALARDSARFLNGYVPHSVCRPSLATILTGLYPHQHGVYFNHPPPGFSQMSRMTVDQWNNHRATAEHLIRDVPTFPRVLATHGYVCLQTGKLWEGDYHNCGFTHGMTLNKPSPEPAYGNRKLSDGLVAQGNGDAGLNIGRDTMEPIFDFVRNFKNKPFLVWYAPLLPHRPFDAPHRFRAAYQNHADIPGHMVDYYAEISRFDDTVGQLVRFIDVQGLAETTILMFASDNGFRPANTREDNRSSDVYDDRSKLSSYENGIRTPILVRWVGRSVSADYPQLVQSIDIMPTILSAAGLQDQVAGLPGIDLMPAALGIKPLPDRPAFGEIYPNDATSLDHPDDEVSCIWVRDGNLKLIMRVPHPSKPDDPSVADIVLYDLANDPDELHNLAATQERADEVRRLRQMLDQWWKPAATHETVDAASPP